MKLANSMAVPQAGAVLPSERWPDTEKLLKKLVRLPLIQEIGFAKAAKEMGLSPQGLYDRLKGLADDLQVDREDIITSGRDATVGLVGQCVEELCVEIDRDIRLFREKLTQVIKELPKTRRSLRVAIVSSVWEQSAAWMTADFEHAMPGMQLVFKSGLASDVQPALLADEADVGIDYTSESRDSKLVDKFWHQEELLFAVSEQYADKARLTQHFKMRKNKAPTMTVADVAGILSNLDDDKNFYLKTKGEFYLMGKGADMTKLVTDYFAKSGVKFPVAEPAHLLTVVEAVGKVHMNLGVSILPVGNIVGKPGFVSFHLAPRLFRRFSIVYPVKTSKKHAINGFIECVLRHNQSPGIEASELT